MSPDAVQFSVGLIALLVGVAVITFAMWRRHRDSATVGEGRPAPSRHRMAGKPLLPIRTPGSCGRRRSPMPRGRARPWTTRWSRRRA
ncbi:MAG: hypothetical protein R2712_03600 [Vicinamibacterales bacterium]